MRNMEIKMMIMQLTSGRLGTFIPWPMLFYNVIYVCKPYPEVEKNRKIFPCFIIDVDPTCLWNWYMVRVASKITGEKMDFYSKVLE